MNNKQLKVLAMLRADGKRDLYEGSTDRRNGNGWFYVSYLGNDPPGDPLTMGEVNELLMAGHIEEKWPSCYKLKQEPPCDS